MPLFRTCVFSSQVVVDHSLTCYPKEVTVCSLADPSNSSPKQKQRPPPTHTPTFNFSSTKKAEN